MIVIIREHRTGDPEFKKRQLNNIIREALKAAAEFWIENYLPLHFTQGAVQRYQYAARSALFLKIKGRATRVRPWVGRTRMGWVPAPKPSRPWVWSGNTMNELLGKSPSEFNIRPVATSKKQRVEVKLPVPHPVSKDHAGELGILTKDEFSMLHKIAHEYINSAIEKIKYGDFKTYRIAA